MRGLGRRLAGRAVQRASQAQEAGTSGQRTADCTGRREREGDQCDQEAGRKDKDKDKDTDTGTTGRTSCIVEQEGRESLEREMLRGPYISKKRSGARSKIAVMGVASREGEEGHLTPCFSALHAHQHRPLANTQPPSRTEATDVAAGTTVRFHLRLSASRACEQAPFHTAALTA